MVNLNSWKVYRSDLGSYMRRWIARCPWGTLRLHNIRESDAGRDFHDHPFAFTSLILKGGYVEHRPGCLCTKLPNFNAWTHYNGIEWIKSNCRFYGPGSIVRRRAEDLHRLELVNGPAWTLVVSGPYFRTWGFQTADGWVDFREYRRSYYRPETKP
jgi:hypothetical protein